MTIAEDDKTIAEAKEKAKALDNWGLFDVHTWSSFPEVNSAVDQIYDEFCSISSKETKPTIQKRHIKVVILDLYVKWCEDPEKYTGYFRGSNYYKPKSRYNKLHISKTTPDVVDNLIILGYVEHVMGNFAREAGFTSHMSRMKATNKLIKLMTDAHHVTEDMIGKYPHTECIILRDIDPDTKKKIDVEYDDTAETHQMRLDLYAYNNLLRQTFIDIPQLLKEGDKLHLKDGNTTISRKNKFVRRIFNNNSWEDGGRFYGGWWQRINSDWREKIYINNTPVVEVDYSGLHIILLYAMQGIDYWVSVDRDPYEIAGLEKSTRMRKLLKQCLLCILNAKNKLNAKRAIQSHINKANMNDEEDNYSWVKEENVSLDEILDKYSATHGIISDYFNSGIGVKLQRLDSRIAERIIGKFTDKEIPVLCIHDSFIISANHEELLNKLMDESIKESVRDIFPELQEIRTKRQGLRGQKWPNLFRNRDIYEDYDTTLGIFDDLVNKLSNEYPEYCEDYKIFRNKQYDSNYYMEEIKDIKI